MPFPWSGCRSHTICYFRLTHIKGWELLLYSITTHIWVAGCSVQFSNDAAYASANYGHSCTALLGFFSWVLLIFYKHLPEKNISCNLNPEFCRLHREFNSGSKGLKYKTSFETFFSMLNIWQNTKVKYFRFYTAWLALQHCICIWTSKTLRCSK